MKLYDVILRSRIDSIIKENKSESLSLKIGNAIGLENFRNFMYFKKELTNGELKEVSHVLGVDCNDLVKGEVSPDELAVYFRKCILNRSEKAIGKILGSKGAKDLVYNRGYMDVCLNIAKHLEEFYAQHFKKVHEWLIHETEYYITEYEDKLLKSNELTLLEYYKGCYVAYKDIHKLVNKIEI